MFQTQQGLPYDIEFSEDNTITLVLYRPNGRATRVTHFSCLNDVLEFLGETKLHEASKVS